MTELSTSTIQESIAQCQPTGTRPDQHAAFQVMASFNDAKDLTITLIEL